MHPVTKVVVTLSDGTERTFMGPGHYKVVNTELTQENWEKNKKDEFELKKTTRPVRFLDVTMSLPTD